MKRKALQPQGASRGLRRALFGQHGQPHSRRHAAKGLGDGYGLVAPTAASALRLEGGARWRTVSSANRG